MRRSKSNRRRRAKHRRAARWFAIGRRMGRLAKFVAKSLAPGFCAFVRDEPSALEIFISRNAPTTEEP